MPNPRLELALRRNKARLSLPQVLADLTTVFGRPTETLNVVGPSEAEHVWSASLVAMDRATRGEAGLWARWRSAEEANLRQFLVDLRSRVLGVRLLLFLPPIAEFCGAVETDSGELLACALALVGGYRDFVAAAENGSCGIALDHYTDWTLEESHSTYDLTLWGDVFEMAVFKSQ